MSYVIRAVLTALLIVAVICIPPIILEYGSVYIAFLYPVILVSAFCAFVALTRKL